MCVETISSYSTLSRDYLSSINQLLTQLLYIIYKHNCNRTLHDTIHVEVFHPQPCDGSTIHHLILHMPVAALQALHKYIRVLPMPCIRTINAGLLDFTNCDNISELWLLLYINIPQYFYINPIIFDISPWCMHSIMNSQKHSIKPCSLIQAMNT